MLVEGIVAAAAGASDPRRVVVFPTVAYSVVEWARPLASVGLSPSTLLSKLVDVGGDVHRLGFRRIVFVQGHGNMPAVQLAMWQLRRDGARALYVDANPYLMAAERADKLAGEPITHAGVIETALMLALHPERVDPAGAVDGPGDLYGDGFPFAALRDRPGVFAVPVVTALPEGVEGAATRADAEMGRRLLALYAGALAEVFNDLLAHEVPDAFVRDLRTETD
jgi:creatinine amidohydrolase